MPQYIEGKTQVATAEKALALEEKFASEVFKILPEYLP